MTQSVPQISTAPRSVSPVTRPSPRAASLRVVPLAELLAEDRGWTRGHAHAAFDEVPRESPGFLDFQPILLAVHQTVDAGAGYAMHPHQGIETLTFMLEGRFVHEDSTGERGEFGADTVSVLSAGSGIRHSEFADASGPARAVMFWVKDGEPEGTPHYETATFPRRERLNRLVCVASRRAGTERRAAAVRQAVRMFAGYFDGSREVVHELEGDRRAYLIATDASVRINGVKVEAGDRVLLSGPGAVAITAEAATDVVMLEV